MIKKIRNFFDKVDRLENFELEMDKLKMHMTEIQNAYVTNSKQKRVSVINVPEKQLEYLIENNLIGNRVEDEAKSVLDSRRKEV